VLSEQLPVGGAGELSAAIGMNDKILRVGTLIKSHTQSGAEREKEKGSEPSIGTHFDWVHSLARWPDRCASSIRGQSIMCLAAGTGEAIFRSDAGMAVGNIESFNFPMRYKLC